MGFTTCRKEPRRSGEEGRGGEGRGYILIVTALNRHWRQHWRSMGQQIQSRYKKNTLYKYGTVWYGMYGTVRYSILLTHSHSQHSEIYHIVAMLVPLMLNDHRTAADDMMRERFYSLYQTRRVSRAEPNKNLK